MHKDTFNITIDEITKIEGTASLDVVVKKGVVQSVKFSVVKFKRFFTKAMKGKPVTAIPQFLSRICGTCSNAHILAATEAVEKSAKLKVSPQTSILRTLTVDGLIVRDHALHLYVFIIPDILGKDNILELDEKDEREHQFLHDAFEVKAAGNYLSQIIAGRSVHAIYPTVGGFLHFPEPKELETAVKKLKKVRPAVLRLIKLFEESTLDFHRPGVSVAMVGNPFNYIEGRIKSSEGLDVPESKLRDHLDRVVIPYSEASTYIADARPYRVGAMSRINLSKDTLHPQTKKDAASALEKFPSDNVYHNNLAQAIETLYSIDRAIDTLSEAKFKEEKPVPLPKNIA